MGSGIPIKWACEHIVGGDVRYNLHLIVEFCNMMYSHFIPHQVYAAMQAYRSLLRTFIINAKGDIAPSTTIEKILGVTPEINVTP